MQITPSVTTLRNQLLCRHSDVPTRLDTGIGALRVRSVSLRNNYVPVCGQNNFEEVAEAFEGGVNIRRDAFTPRGPWRG